MAYVIVFFLIFVRFDLPRTEEEAVAGITNVMLFSCFNRFNK